MADEPKSVSDILDRLEDAADGDDDVPVRDVTDAFGHRSFGPFLIVPALLELSPLGAVPGVPTVLAAVVILFAAQILLGRRNFWIPGILADRRISADRLRKAADKLRPVGERLDRWFHGRLDWLTRGPAVRIAAAVCILLALTVPPLELLPFASSGPMAAIAAFGLALLVRDGLLMIAAGVLTVATFAIGLGFLGS